MRKFSMRVASISEPSGVNLFAENPGADGLLPPGEYDEYYGAIVRNDAQQVRSILAKLPAEKLRLLLDAEFEFDACETPLMHKESYSPALPLHVAVYVGAHDVFKVLMSKGATVTKADQNESTVLHTLVAFAFYEPDDEPRACATYHFLREELGPEKLATLLATENGDGLRPVEFAAQQGTLQLVDAMLTSPGPYLMEKRTTGLNEYTFIDVTEYETGERQDKSPLFMLAHLDSTKLGDTDAARMLATPLMRAWITAKVRSNYPMIFAWACLRFLVLAIHLATDYDSTSVKHLVREENKNITDELCSQFINMNYPDGIRHLLVYFNLASSCLIILYDICEIIYLVARKKYLALKNLHGVKNVIINVLFYRGCEFITMTLSVLLISYNIHTHEDLHNVAHSVQRLLYYFRVLLPIFIVWSIFYFAQCLPWIGDSIMGIQGMVKDMVRFVFLMFVFMLPFVHAFYLGISAESKEGCIEDFSTVARSFYTLFRMSLNAVDPTSFSLHHSDAFYLMHVVYIYVVGIVLLNFLIAVMSNVQAHLEQNEKVIGTLNKLSIACYAEMRTRVIFKAFYHRYKQYMFLFRKDGKVAVVYRVARHAEFNNDG